MEKKFSVVVLSSSGDFLLEKESELHRENRGVEIENPWIINEDEKVQQVQASEIFIPYSSIENIQYGNFEQETV